MKSKLALVIGLTVALLLTASCGRQQGSSVKPEGDAQARIEFLEGEEHDFGTYYERDTALVPLHVGLVLRASRRPWCYRHHPRELRRQRFRSRLLRETLRHLLECRHRLSPAHSWQILRERVKIH